VAHSAQVIMLHKLASGWRSTNQWDQLLIYKNIHQTQY